MKTTKATRPAQIVVFEDEDIRVLDRADGYYWTWRGEHSAHGPFRTLEAALDDSGSAPSFAEPADDAAEDIGYEAAFGNWDRDLLLN